MRRRIEQVDIEGQHGVRLCSEHLEIDVVPRVGGRIVRCFHPGSGHEFLWRNPGLVLKVKSPGTPYDPNFYGGIDELLPNDIPETIDDNSYPDHGELWTKELDWRIDNETLALAGTLPQSGLVYQRWMCLREDVPVVEFRYRITNPTGHPRHFLWKLHAALAVAEGDVIDCPARQGQVVDPAYSRFSSLSPFPWPQIEQQRADLVPPRNGTADFFYLFDLDAGRIGWRRPSRRLKFQYTFDTAVFPFAWLFASYGNFEGHYTVILEPCTTMPIGVGEAMQSGRCSRLLPGQAVETQVSLYAGWDDSEVRKIAWGASY